MIGYHLCTLPSIRIRKSCIKKAFQLSPFLTLLFFTTMNTQSCGLPNQLLVSMTTELTRWGPRRGLRVPQFCQRGDDCCLCHNGLTTDLHLCRGFWDRTAFSRHAVWSHCACHVTRRAGRRPTIRQSKEQS